MNDARSNLSGSVPQQRRAASNTRRCAVLGRKRGSPGGRFRAAQRIASLWDRHLRDTVRKGNDRAHLRQLLPMQRLLFDFVGMAQKRSNRVCNVSRFTLSTFPDVSAGEHWRRQSRDPRARGTAARGVAPTSRAEVISMLGLAAFPLRRMLADRRGLKAIEYAILAAIVVIAVAGLTGPLDALLTDVYDTMLSKVPT
jgi:Flp pilus assembly pilin Flp